VPYNYHSSMPFRGEAEKALGLAESALTALGFRITEHTPASIELVGPSMNSTRQSPLVGASRVRIMNRQGELAVEAELGGVERMSRFVTLFPLGLGLVLGLVMWIVFSALGRAGAGIMPAIIPLIATAPWLVIGPLMARSIRARTGRALDVLVANMVVVGECRES
jgi:hypothetical protein